MDEQIAQKMDKMLLVLKEEMEKIGYEGFESALNNAKLIAILPELKSLGKDVPIYENIADAIEKLVYGSAEESDMNFIQVDSLRIRADLRKKKNRL